jgi:hypothetical protein
VGVNSIFCFIVCHPSTPTARPTTLAASTSNNPLKPSTDSYVNDFEAALLSNNATAYRELLDVPAAVDYLLGTELTKNPDGYRCACFFAACMCG